MSTPQEYADRIEAVGLNKIEITIGSVPEAKVAALQLRAAKKQLQQVKKEISADMRAIRATHQQQMSGTGSTGSGFMQTLGILGVKGMKGQAKSYQADAKRRVKGQQDKALAPYERLKLTVDSLISQIDVALAQIDGFILANQSKQGP